MKDMGREGSPFPVRLEVKSCLATVISGYEKRSVEPFFFFQSRTFPVIRERIDRSDAIGRCEFISETDGRVRFERNKFDRR